MTKQEEEEDNEYAGSSRPNGFLAEESSDADEDSQASDADEDDDSDGRVWSNVGVAIAALAALPVSSEPDSVGCHIPALATTSHTSVAAAPWHCMRIGPGAACVHAHGASTCKPDAAVRVGAG